MVGVIGGFNSLVDSGHLLQHRLTVTGCFLGAVMGNPSSHKLIEELLRDCAEGRFTVPVDATFTMSDIAEAHRRAETPGRLGVSS